MAIRTCLNAAINISAGQSRADLVLRLPPRVASCTSVCFRPVTWFVWCLGNHTAWTRTRAQQHLRCLCVCEFYERNSIIDALLWKMKAGGKVLVFRPPAVSSLPPSRPSPRLDLCMCLCESRCAGARNTSAQSERVFQSSGRCVRSFRELDN